MAKNITREQAAKYLKKAGKTQAEIAAQLGGGAPDLPKPNKYNAKSTRSDIIGRNFHSGAERRYAEWLYARQQNGEIENLQFQMHVKLLGIIGMIVDFYYVEDGEPVWDEFKGKEMAPWRQQVKLWEQVGPGRYRVTKEVRGRFETVKDIYPNPNAELRRIVLKAILADMEARP